MRTLRRLSACLAALGAMLVLAAPASAGLLGKQSTVGDWTLGGLPCELIEVPAATPLGTGACP